VSSVHTLEVDTKGPKRAISIAPKIVGRGSSINVGELLFAAFVTCFCSYLYREAANRSIHVHGVAVEVTGTFGSPGGRKRREERHASYF
jgi:uncharacterized OsmC-like protein